MPAVPRRGPGTSRYTNPAVYPYCCFQAPVAALPAPFSYTHRPGRSGRHGPGGECGMPAGQARAVYPSPSTPDRPPRTAHPSRLPRTDLHQAVYPGPTPNPSTLHRPPRTVPPSRLPRADLPTRLPCTGLPEPVYPGPPSQNRPPNPSTLYRPPEPVYPRPPPTTDPSTLYRPPNPSTLCRPPRTVYPGPTTKSRPPSPSTLDRPPEPPPRAVYPVPPTRARLPCAAYPFYSLNIYCTRGLSTLSPSLSRLPLLYPTLNNLLYRFPYQKLDPKHSLPF